jgi:hypothetical protein
MRRTPLAAIAAGALILAACGSSGVVPSAAPPSPSNDPADLARAPEFVPTAPVLDPIRTETQAATTDGDPFEIEQIASSPSNVTVSGFDVYRSGDPQGTPTPIVPLNEIRSGGPPPDGIPPIDEPKFLNPSDVGFLADNEPVLAFEIDGDARAYPVQVMTWHEIVNDTVAGIPVTISYCPLCNSAIAYDRRHDGLILDFGTSGLLYNSALVMYDRQTQTLWSHFIAQGIVGELTGQQVETFPLSTVAWSTWRDANPNGLVLSRDTGHSREYGRNPYPGYDNVDGNPFLFQGSVDGRYTAMTRIVGVQDDVNPVGVPLIDLEAAQIITGDLTGDPLVFLWTRGTASALDSSTVNAGVDVGATGVFRPAVDGVGLTFTPADDGANFIDDQTGSTWNILGRAIAGEMSGAQLEGVPHVDTFWFAWSTFRPDAAILTG